MRASIAKTCGPVRLGGEIQQTRMVFKYAYDNGLIDKPIRYDDGTEELYDHRNDPREWYNLADDEKYTNVKKRLAKWLPKADAKNAPRLNRKWWPGKGTK